MRKTDSPQIIGEISKHEVRNTKQIQINQIQNPKQNNLSLKNLNLDIVYVSHRVFDTKRDFGFLPKITKSSILLNFQHPQKSYFISSQRFLGEIRIWY